METVPLLVSIKYVSLINFWLFGPVLVLFGALLIFGRGEYDFHCGHTFWQLTTKTYDIFKIPKWIFGNFQITACMHLTLWQRDKRDTNENLTGRCTHTSASQCKILFLKSHRIYQIYYNVLLLYILVLDANYKLRHKYKGKSKKHFISSPPTPLDWR